jgi:hypothetical protein
MYVHLGHQQYTTAAMSRGARGGHQEASAEKKGRMLHVFCVGELRGRAERERGRGAERERKRKRERRREYRASGGILSPSQRTSTSASPP